MVITGSKIITKNERKLIKLEFVGFISRLDTLNNIKYVINIITPSMTLLSIL